MEVKNAYLNVGLKKEIRDSKEVPECLVKKDFADFQVKKAIWGPKEIKEIQDQWDLEDPKVTEENLAYLDILV